MCEKESEGEREGGKMPREESNLTSNRSSFGCTWSQSFSSITSQRGKTLTNWIGRKQQQQKQQQQGCIAKNQIKWETVFSRIWKYFLEKQNFKIYLVLVSYVELG